MTKKKLYITTAIPYVNAKPHIGNALDYLLADIWARWQRQEGREVRFQAGTDEHGNKIAAKAAENGLDPKAYVDQTHVNFTQMIEKLNISATDFVRTTDDHHRGAVQYIWQKLVAAGYIYKGSYEGWYCIGCESFVTDKEATENNGICPDHNQPYQRLSEENYYFKASALSDQVRAAIESGKMQIVPNFRKQEFLELMKDGLKDVSFSRPRKNLSWGIAVPGDDTQVMYVWADALSNYLTILGYPDQPEWQDFWPADMQVVGKDILRFHAGIWPAMLLALDVSLPKKLLVHGFVNVGGAKMSKTVGNVVDPLEIADQYGVDAFRYYFSRHIPTLDDGDFTWEKFEAAYNGELANDLGNLVQRVAVMVRNYQAGVVKMEHRTEHDRGTYLKALEASDFNAAIADVWRLIRSLNQYLEEVKPWQVAKSLSTDPEAADHLEEVLSYLVDSILQVGDMLTPFLPATAEAIAHGFANGIVSPDLTVLFPKIYLHTPAPTRQ